MPRGDGTGPNGQGPMTGRALGYCSGNDRPGFMESGAGFRGGGRFRAFGHGFGRGRGFAWRARAMPIQSQFQDMPIQQPTVITEKQEKQLLEQELGALKEEIKEVEARLKELKK